MLLIFEIKIHLELIFQHLDCELLKIILIILLHGKTKQQINIIQICEQHFLGIKVM
jgi:hypothetical protein